MAADVIPVSSSHPPPQSITSRPGEWLELLSSAFCVTNFFLFRLHLLLNRLIEALPGLEHLKDTIAEFSSDIQQAQRRKLLSRFKKGELKVRQPLPSSCPSWDTSSICGPKYGRFRKLASWESAGFFFFSFASFSLMHLLTRVV